MRPTPFRNALLVTALAITVGACNQNRDAEYTEALLGTWVMQDMMEGGAVLDAETTFLSGGRVNWSGRISYQGQSVPIIASGTWRVENGHLHYTVETSNITELLPNGFASADSIVSVSAKEYVYVSGSEGETVVEQRKT